MIRFFRFLPERWGKRRLLLAGGGLLLALAGAGTAWWWFSRPPEIVVVRRRKAPKVTLDRAVELFESGHYEEALDFCIKNRKFYRDDPAFWNFYGMALRTMAYVDSNLSDRDEEIAAFEKALALDPGFTAARMNYANSLWETGKHEEAVAQYRQVLRENPDHPDFRAILERMENDRIRRALREEEARRRAESKPVAPAAPSPAPADGPMAAETPEASRKDAEPSVPMPAPMPAEPSVPMPAPMPAEPSGPEPAIPMR